MTQMQRLTSRAKHADRGDDLYETPPCATWALLEVEKLPHRIWEPAAGRGSIVNVLRAAGHQVLGTDLVDYGINGDCAGLDFTTMNVRRLPQHFSFEAIVTNPPYKAAEAFVRRALALCPRVYMLLRLAFLEASRRLDILESGALRRVYVFRNRLPMMHRDGWDGPRSTSAIAFAWFCWNSEDPGPTELKRLSWRPNN